MGTRTEAYMNYLVQINDEIREATPEETAAINAQRDAAAQLEAQRAEQEAAKQSARAKLAALGLTEAEIAALIP